MNLILKKFNISITFLEYLFGALGVQTQLISHLVYLLESQVKTLQNFVVIKNQVIQSGFEVRPNNRGLLVLE